MEEKKLKDWRLTTKRAQWKAERKAVQNEAERKKSIINNEAEDRVSAIKANMESQIRGIYAEAARKKADVETWQYGEIVRIAQEQDDYEMAFREYVASLPKEMAQASVALERM